MIIDIIRKHEFDNQLKRSEGDYLPLFYPLISGLEVIISDSVSDDFSNLPFFFPIINTFIQMDLFWSIVSEKISKNLYTRFMNFRGGDFYKLKNNVPSLKHIPASVHAEIAEDLKLDPFDLFYDVYFLNNWFPLIGG